MILRKALEIWRELRLSLDIEWQKFSDILCEDVNTLNTIYDTEKGADNSRKFAVAQSSGITTRHMWIWKYIKHNNKWYWGRCWGFGCICCHSFYSDEHKDIHRQKSNMLITNDTEESRGDLRKFAVTLSSAATAKISRVNMQKCKYVKYVNNKWYRGKCWEFEETYCRTLFSDDRQKCEIC